MWPIIMLFLAAAPAWAADVYPPTAEQRRQMEAKTVELTARVDALRGKTSDAALLADVDVYRKAAEWIQRYPEEFYTKAYAANTLAVLDKGLACARELESGAPAWPKQKGRLARAYISRVDGSVQPYGLIIPDSYNGQPARLDLVLHGRGATLNEVSFLSAHDGAEPVPAGQDFLTLEVFGRTNNAYRWSGETDVFEALASVRERYNIDPKRIVLRGFSMGGAGAWHLGLHYPGQWAAFEAGAGFTETKRYAGKESLPAYQEAALHIYDAADYALNAFDTPTIGYGGEDDAQLQASTNIREALMREGFHFEQGPYRWTATDLRALFLIGPKTGHKFHPDSKRESGAFIEQALATTGTTPSHLRFVAYTTRYDRCDWLTVEALEKQYERAQVDARRSDDGRQFSVTTKNVARLRLEAAPNGRSFTIDGQAFAAAAEEVVFEKRSGKWSLEPPRSAKNAPLRKVHGLQGPVDDAFRDGFLCVRPTAQPFHAAAGDYAERTLRRFAAEFPKWLRGDVRVKDDRDVSESDIARYHLILFGDPASNSVLARVLPKLPVRWTKSEITLGTKKFSAAEYVAVLIYPNPLNPRRYVVVNSGHTFGEAEFRGTNALLYPRLGDYAIVRAADGEVLLSGFFNEWWKF